MMREKSKYFRLNRLGEFQRGHWEEQLRWEEGVTLLPGSGGRLISRPFDSGGKETQWYRLSSRCTLPNNTACRLTIFTSETSTIQLPKGEKMELEEYIASPLSWEEKLRQFAPYEVMRLPLEPELLLYEAKGRYLWFALELTASQEQSPKIREMKLSFGGKSWLRDLPELFQTQDDGFLRRYLAIFQTMYEEMEETIETTVKNYTPQQAPEEFLQWLSSWYCIQEQSLWSREQLRELLAHARELYQAMGTRWSVEFLCQLYLGQPVQIVEYYQKDDPDFVCPDGVRRDQLFPNPYVFVVLVPERLIQGRSQYLALLKILDSCKPVYLQARVILLRENPWDVGIRVGQECCLSSGMGGSSFGGIILREPEMGEEE